MIKVQKKRSRVFIGLENTANNLNTFAQALRSAGVKADAVVWKNSNHAFNYGQEKELFLFNKRPFPGANNLLKYFHVFNMIRKYDTFILISPLSLLPNNKDLDILRFFNKKIVFVFCGCTERRVDLEPGNPEYLCNRCVDSEKQKRCLCTQINKKIELVQNLEKYASYIITQTDSAGYLKNNKKNIWFHVISLPPVKKDYLAKYNSTEIVITHIPSNPLIKLSHIIIPVLERLKKEYPNVTLVIKSGITHDNVIELLEKTHILVDALGLGYGSLAVEGMARGSVAVTGHMTWLKKEVPACPVVTSTIDDLYSVLKKLVENKTELKAIAEKSMKFYEEYHSLEAAGNYYKKNLELV